MALNLIGRQPEIEKSNVAKLEKSISSKDRRDKHDTCITQTYHRSQPNSASKGRVMILTAMLAMVYTLLNFIYPQNVVITKCFVIISIIYAIMALTVGISIVILSRRFHRRSPVGSKMFAMETYCNSYICLLGLDNIEKINNMDQP